jgi:hypothetical protein
MKRASTVAEWNEREKVRREAISTNASRRLRRLPHVPVPEKLGKPLAYMVEESDGTYVGTFGKQDEAQEYCRDNPGCRIVEVEAIR